MQKKVVDLICRPNPLQEKYKSHKELAVVAIIRLDDKSYIRRFFKTEKEVFDWFLALQQENRVVLH